MCLNKFGAAVLAAAGVGLSVCASGPDNGDFSLELKGSWRGGSFGGGEGAVRRVVEGMNAFLRIEKTRGPGGTQAFSSIVPLGGAPRFRLTMRYRMNTGLFFVRYRTKGATGWEVAKDVLGKEASVTLNTLRRDPVAQRGEWTAFAREFTVPKALRNDASLAVVLQAQAYPVQGGVGFFELDDVRIEPMDAPPPQKAPVPAKLTIRRGPIEREYDPIVYQEPFEWQIRDGLFYRNGKPFFFAGFGSETGAGMDSPTGLWLAKLQGVRFVSLYHHPAGSFAKTGDNAYEYRAERHPGWTSWQREANRLGFLTEPHPLTSYGKDSVWGRYAEAHPEFRETYFNLGHYLSVDGGSREGRELLAANREQYFAYTWPERRDYCELAREPGPERMNARMRDAFRAFVRAKYDGDLALVNRIWKTSFASWDEVRPLHLDTDELADTSKALALRRHVHATKPEHYWDCLLFSRADTTLRTRNEMEDIRALVPGLPVTVDIRGHHAYTDGYCAFDPDWIAPLEDVFHIHYGYKAVDYNATPCHAQTLADETCFPLFNYAYALANTGLPLVNSEDIIADVSLPGSDAEAMAKNDLGGLHLSPWKFRLEEKGEDGRKAKWHATDLDEAGWDEMTVPGCWDETKRYRGRSGVAWYRKRFTPPGRLRADYLDGSRKFSVYGRGVAQEGTLWLNGEKVGDVKGWDTPYRFDVGALLKFGQENEIVWRVDGSGYNNGLRAFCHILAQDMVNTVKPFGEKQYAAMWWTYLMRGSSGVLNWNWQKKDRLRPYLADILPPLEVAAEVALEDLRHRKGKVAYLYGFMAQRGLPCISENRHRETLDWYNAIEQSGVRPDVVSERTFRERVTAKSHPLLVVPETAIVDDATYAAFKRYLADGGKVILSTNSLVRTFSRYAPTDVRALKGDLSFWPNGLGFFELRRRLAPLLPQPGVAVREVGEAKSLAGETEELCFERTLAGGADAKVLYLFNWGGLDHAVRVTLPDDVRSWTVTDLRGAFVRAADGTLTTTVPAQAPAACLLTRGDPSAYAARLKPARPEVWKRLVALNEEKDTGRPKILWSHEKHYYPYILDRFASFGCETRQVPAAEWTPELLAGCKVAVVAEAGTGSEIRRLQARKDFVPMMKKWVEGGGSLFILGHSGGTINAYGNVLRFLSAPFGLNGAWVSLAKDTAHRDPAYGDPRQIRAPVAETAAAAETELLAGVRSVSLYALSPMKKTKDSAARGIVTIPSGAEAHAGEIAMGAVDFGKGRVFVSADTMAFQPFRIEQADNAVLLENIVGWLLRQPVAAEQREAFKNDLFVR